ncbi:MAG: YchE family NAAT transporter [Xanthomonadaceae bacterium]|nr:YchE family NAAT transporter [Xanthomonadaceae bacterium]
MAHKPPRLPAAAPTSGDAVTTLSFADYLKVFVGLLAIINPLGVAPVFIGLTRHHTPAERRRIAKVAALSMTLILLGGLLAGESVLAFFGITMASFRVGGGILIMLIALSMLHGQESRARQTTAEVQESAERDSVAVVPLSIPLLAGPGGISAVIVYAHLDDSLGHYLLLALNIVSMGVLALLVLLAAPALSERLGRTGINIVTRIMGLILMAIAIEFIAGGLRELFPVLA